jgi:hypothetical protein
MLRSEHRGTWGGALRVPSLLVMVVIVVMVVVVVTLVGACGLAKGPTSFDDGTAGGGTSGSPAFGHGDGGPQFGGSSGGGLADAACATETHKSQSVPVDIYILMDKSGSMNDSSKWSSVVSAFGSFVADPKSAGLGVGLQYFPLAGVIDPTCVSKCTDCGCVQSCGCSGCSCTNNVCSCPSGASGDSCNSADYAKPAVSIAPLPGVASSINASLSATSPNGGTPTKAALLGGVAYAKDFMAQHPDHRVVLVLATDGDPNACSSNLLNAAAEVAQVAQDAVSGAPSIKTFVIGVGSEVTKLDQVAAAGGTQKAYLVDTGAGATQQFVDALDKIKDSTIACEYAIPALAAGQIDYGKVNVAYESGGQQVLVPQVASKSACDPTKGGWYYDAPAPTKIEICDASCGAFNQIGVVQVDVVYGCETQKAPPVK